MPTPLTASLPYLTAEIPGVGGVIRARDEDFLVEEQPLYQPCGSGEHLFLYIEKQGRATTDVVHRLARLFGVSKSDVGYAGMKDKHAVTRQHFSVRLPDAGDDAKLLSRMEHTDFKLLWSARHTNKLRRGHLAGNRFIIRIRQVEPSAVVRARDILGRLAALGVPNFIGEQRFGYKQNNHLLGRMLLLGQYQQLLDEMLGRPGPSDNPATRAGREAYERHDYAAALETWPRHLRHDRCALDGLRQGRSPQQVVMSIDQAQREFLVCALQSYVFNRVLERRLRAEVGTPFPQLMAGDLAWKHDNGAVFAVDRATAEKENAPGGRVPTMAVSPSGPMWGLSMLTAQGVPAQEERQALEDFGVTPESFAASAATIQGLRRPLRMIIKDPDISAGADDYGPYIRVAFELPRGCFATTVLREISKPQQTGATLPEEPLES
jgi:tRNA pseudouridine13 synthase